MKNVKEAKTIEEQIAILKSRNLIIEDEDFAYKILLATNYYNFTGYLHTYKDSNGNYSGITFNNAYRIYLCDKRIKAIILYAIEIVEHNIKTNIAYTVAHMLGPLAYMNPDNFTDKDEHTELIKRFHKAVKTNKKIPFVKHHIINYENNFPIWVAIEIFTLGMVWNCYKYLNNPIRKKIASNLNVGSVYLESWIECISYLRNLCAHYMRLYRFNIQKTPKSSKKHNVYPATNRIFDIIYVIKFLMPDTDEWKKYVIPLITQIFDEYSDVVTPKDYGFPDNWNEIL